ncbi:hypothetical protein THOG11_50134 [Vibrio harveyi]|nr:hypothetical protein TH15OA1_500097 [Vibrio harveyi]CAH1580075.1 hypothetical protein THOG11_50134 [Vibrio harveyi]
MLSIFLIKRVMFDEINLFLSPLDFTPSSLFFAAYRVDDLHTLTAGM